MKHFEDYFKFGTAAVALLACASTLMAAPDATERADRAAHPDVIPGRRVNIGLHEPSQRQVEFMEQGHRADFDGDDTAAAAGFDDSGSRKVASGGYNYLEGPDGSTWYYTASYEMQDIYYNEYYTDHILHSFTFNIYDSSRRLVGTVKDKIRYASNEIRDRECVLDPSVSLHFFNTDDKPEVMVYHAMNTDIYVNHYYYDVYSIGGEKDEEGYDRSIARIEGRCLDVINNSKTPADENFYYVFVLDPVVDFPADDPDYVAKLNEKTFHITTYAKAKNNEDGPVVYLEKDIYGTRVPGDTTEGAYFLTKRHLNDLYFIFSQYDKPFFYDPRGSAEDERPMPDNSLVIDVYKIADEEPEYVSYTKIPVNAEESEEHLIYTFLSIGSVAWSDDIDMTYNGTPQAPAFIVARDVAYASDIDNLISSYYIYDTDGNLLKTIAEDTENMYLFRNGDPEGPLGMFVKRDPEGFYNFVFAYIFTGDRLATISQANDGDPLYATCYPIKINGEYKFVFEMMRFEAGKDNNMFARVAWFGTGTGLERIDRINIGADVQAALVYLSGVTLNPTLFDNDDKMEYAVLVKRAYGSTIRNEYLVVDDNGGRYATFSADDGKGEPVDLSIIVGRPNRIRVQYNDNGRTNTTYVDLPFTTPSVGGTDDNDDGLSEESISVDLNGTDEYYDLQGRIVKSPEKGIYIRKSGTSVSKVTVK